MPPNLTPNGSFTLVGWLRVALACVLVLFAANGVHAQVPTYGLPARADLEQHLGAQIPLDLVFTDFMGRDVPLSHFFGQRPVILQMGYNHCWLMCDVVTGALVRSLQDLRLNPGTDFDVVFVSIDPSETWQLAAKKRAQYIQSFGRSKTGPGWHFLTGREPEIRALANAVGFHYFYDLKSQQFAHPSGLMVATPNGVLSKYFYGVEYNPTLLRESLLEASGGMVGSRVEALLLLCFHWNPMSGKYGWLIAAVLKTLCLGTVAALGAYIVVHVRRDVRQRRLDETNPILP